MGLPLFFALAGSACKGCGCGASVEQESQQPLEPQQRLDPPPSMPPPLPSPRISENICRPEELIVDTNNNGLPDCLDRYFASLLPPERGLGEICGPDQMQQDSNGNGLPDCLDDFLNNRPRDPGEPPSDADNDGIPDNQDNCPGVAGPQFDTDRDGEGDVCDQDDDGDRICDGPDAVNDADGNPLCTAGPDNCPLLVNPDQANNDTDPQGNACDPDDDNDGICDPGVSDPSCSGSDLCPLVANPPRDCDRDPATPDTQCDWDGDGLGDECDQDVSDNDTDGDGCPDILDEDMNTDPDGDGVIATIDTHPLQSEIDPVTGVNYLGNHRECLWVSATECARDPFTNESLDPDEEADFGNPANPNSGTFYKPFCQITTANRFAGLLMRNKICVVGGTGEEPYRESFVLRNGLKLIGGYGQMRSMPLPRPRSCRTDFDGDGSTTDEEVFFYREHRFTLDQVNNPEFVTRLHAPLRRLATGEANSPAAIRTNINATRETEIIGFIIQGGIYHTEAFPDEELAAILVRGSPTIRKNMILGGTFDATFATPEYWASRRSAGIKVTCGDSGTTTLPLISENFAISGGIAEKVSSGILLECKDLGEIGAVIKNNGFIYGGKGFSVDGFGPFESYGISVDHRGRGNLSLEIEGNAIISGNPKLRTDSSVAPAAIYGGGINFLQQTSRGDEDDPLPLLKANIVNNTAITSGTLINPMGTLGHLFGIHGYVVGSSMGGGETSNGEMRLFVKGNSIIGGRTQPPYSPPYPATTYGMGLFSAKMTADSPTPILQIAAYNNQIQGGIASALSTAVSLGRRILPADPVAAETGFTSSAFVRNRIIGGIASFATTGFTMNGGHGPSFLLSNWIAGSLAGLRARGLILSQDFTLLPAGEYHRVLNNTINTGSCAAPAVGTAAGIAVLSNATTAVLKNNLISTTAYNQTNCPNTIGLILSRIEPGDDPREVATAQSSHSLLDLVWSGTWTTTEPPYTYGFGPGAGAFVPGVDDIPLGDLTLEEPSDTANRAEEACELNEGDPISAVEWTPSVDTPVLGHLFRDNPCAPTLREVETHLLVGDRSPYSPGSFLLLSPDSPAIGLGTLIGDETHDLFNLFFHADLGIFPGALAFTDLQQDLSGGPRQSGPIDIGADEY